jgi:hypothetical protein
MANMMSSANVASITPTLRIRVPGPPAPAPSRVGRGNGSAQSSARTKKLAPAYSSDELGTPVIKAAPYRA